MKKKRIFLIIFCLIIITSTVLIYNHNKTKVTPTEANIQKVQSEKNSSQNNVRNNKNSKNNSGNKEVLEEEGKNDDSETKETETPTIIKNNNSKNLDHVKNLDKISSLEIVDSSIEK